MAQSFQELNTIHLKSWAEYNKKYICSNGFTYIGTQDKRLRQLDNASNIISALPNTVNNTTIQNIINNIITNPSTGFTSQDNITAFATGGQAFATPLTCDYNRIDTVVTAGDSVITKNATGLITIRQIIRNFGNNSMNLFPYLGNNFKGMPINTQLSIDPGNGVEIVAYLGDTGVWTI